jgi:hypothetical protein
MRSMKIKEDELTNSQWYDGKHWRLQWAAASHGRIGRTMIGDAHHLAAGLQHP